MNPSRLFTIDTNLIICLAVAWLIELALGSPRFIARLAQRFARVMDIIAERVLSLARRRRGRSAPAEKTAGVLLLIYLAAFSFILISVFLNMMRGLHPSLYYIFNTLIIYKAFQTRTAADGASAERKALRGGDAGEIARIISDLSKICLDGACAPLFVISAGVLLGVPAAFAAAYITLSIYRGAAEKKGGELENLGWAAFKLNDIVKFIPARLCCVVLPLLAPVCGTGFFGIAAGYRATREAQAVRSFSNNYTNLNYAWPAAAFAGILGIRFGSGAAYKNVLKPEYKLKDAGFTLREPEIPDIGRAVKLLLASSLSALIICCAALLYIATSFQ